MSSRQEEKEQRRKERIAAEEAAKKAEARRRTLGIAVGGVLVVVAIAAVVVTLVAGGGDGKTKTKTPNTSVAVPAQKVTDLAAAAKAAGCSLQSFPKGYNDREHVTGSVTYKTNPPTYGPHAPPPNWAPDGDYVGQGTPPKERLVHSLEHGRVVIQYKPGLNSRRVAQLETLFNEKPLPGVISGYNTLLVENNTNMPYEVAATAWTQLLGCKTFNDKTFDAIRAFRTKYTDKGPELIQTHE